MDFSTLFQDSQIENITSENPNAQITESQRKLNESRLFLCGLLFFLVVILAVFTIKLYNKVIRSCAPAVCPGVKPVEEDEVEEIIVFSTEMEELATPLIIHIERDLETNNNSDSDNQIFKKNN